MRGGPALQLILMFALPGLVFALLYVVQQRRWMAWVTGALIAAVIASGIGGLIMDRARTDRAVADNSNSYSREDLALMHERGYEESLVALKSGAVVDGVIAAVLAVGLVRRRRSVA